MTDTYYKQMLDVSRDQRLRQEALKIIEPALKELGPEGVAFIDFTIMENLPDLLRMNIQSVVAKSLQNQFDLATYSFVFKQFSVLMGKENDKWNGTITVIKKE